MKRDELIEAVRTQVDMDQEDLPSATATLFLREAFQRTAALERRWPSCEADWEYTLDADEQTAVIDPATAEIISVFKKGTTRRLTFADHELIRTSSGWLGSDPSLFSRWAGKLYFWPIPNVETTFVVSGYRRPSEAWLADPALEADLDPRLHIPLMHYAVALTYAQQEDPEGEAQYMRRWEIGTATAVADIVRPDAYRPLVLSGGLDQRF